MQNAFVFACGCAVVLTLFIILPWAFSHDDGRFQASLLRREQAQLEQSLQTMARRASPEADDDSISWQRCKQLDEGCAHRRIHLRQKDFRYGTLRVKYPCVLLLDEDIVFNPNPEHDHRVSEQQRVNGDYPQRSAFVLGFFAAISIETHHVLLDLNGHRFEQHHLFAAKQAFYTHVALSPPFIMNEGPADFATEFSSAEHVVIKNSGQRGGFFRSSHHAIHGNGARHVYIDHLVIRDYEVAAIALNGCEHVRINRVEALGTFTDVPELATFDQARFLIPFMESLAHLDELLAQSLHTLRVLVEQAQYDIDRRRRIDRQRHAAAYKLFANEHGVSDGGSTYGIIITDFGMAVNAFGSGYVNGEGSRHVLIENTWINGTISRAREVLCTRFVDAKQTPLAGPAGDIVEFERVIDQYDGWPSRDALLHAQLSLASAVERLVPADERKRRFPTLAVPIEIVRWFRATNGGEANIAGELTQLYHDKRIHYTRRGDAMNHFNKGAIGLRLDSSLGIYLENVKVDHTLALGDAGKTNDLPGEGHENELDHPNQAPFVGYHGNVATGILQAGAEDVHMQNVQVGQVYSRTGRAYMQRDMAGTKTK